MIDPDHQSLDPDPELESPDITKRVEIRLRSRIRRNRNTSSWDSEKVSLYTHYPMFPFTTVKDSFCAI